MNKSELVDAVAQAAGTDKRTVERVLSEFTDTVQRAVARGDRVSLPGFLTFSRADRKARTARNPQTGAAIKIAATRVPKVSAGAAFKAAVGGGGATKKAAASKKKSTAKKAGAARKASKSRKR